MPGVEILNTTIHYKEVLPTWVIIVIIAIIVIPAMAMLIGSSVHSDLLVTIGGISLILGFVLALIIGSTIRQTTNEIEYIEHEVLVDDSVSFTEFNEKYETVSQKGKIYVVREKENDWGTSSTLHITVAITHNNRNQG